MRAGDQRFDFDDRLTDDLNVSSKRKRRWEILEARCSWAPSVVELSVVEFYNNEMVIKDPCGDDTPGVGFQIRNIRVTSQAHYMSRTMIPRAARPSINTCSGG
jgi:hypothetical protein